MPSWLSARAREFARERFPHLKSIGLSRGYPFTVEDLMSFARLVAREAAFRALLPRHYEEHPPVSEAIARVLEDMERETPDA